MWILVFMSKFHNVSGTCTIRPEIKIKREEKKRSCYEMRTRSRKKVLTYKFFVVDDFEYSNASVCLKCGVNFAAKSILDAHGEQRIHLMSALTCG